MQAEGLSRAYLLRDELVALPDDRARLLDAVSVPSKPDQFAAVIAGGYTAVFRIVGEGLVVENVLNLKRARALLAAANELDG